MSFAAEVKDFLGAAQSTYKMLDDAEYSKFRRAYMKAQTDKLNYDLNDPTAKAQKEANLAATRANTAATIQSTNDPLRDKVRLAQIEASNSTAEERRARAAAWARAGQPQPEEDVLGGYTPQRAVTPRPAIGGDPNSSEGYYARGGLVQKFADGGVVEDEDLDPADEDDVAPPVTPAVTPRVTDMSAQRRPQISKEAAHDAVEAGLKHGVEQLGPTGGVPSPVRQQRLQALARGAGAAPVADMNAIYKKIDPNNEMGESERALNALSAVYQHKLRKGDPQGAQRTAFAMLQHYRLASQRYAAIAAAAAENGDIDGAAKAAMKAYANIPDGKGLKVSKGADGQLTYSVIDEQTGKTVNQGIASPQQLAAAAMGVATKGFDSFLLDAAGQRAATRGAVGGSRTGGGPKPKEAEDLRNATGQVIDDFAAKAKEAGKDITDDQIKAMKNASYHISRSNDLTPDEAFSAARTFITAPEPAKDKDGKVGARPFEIKRDEDSGKNRIMFGDSGREIELSDAELRPLIVLRQKAQKEIASKSTEPKGKSYGDYAADAGRAAIGAVGDAVDWAKSDLEKAGQTEFGARAKSAIGAIGRAATDAYEWAKDDLSKSSVLRGVMNGPGKGKL